MRARRAASGAPRRRPPPGRSARRRTRPGARTPTTKSSRDSAAAVNASTAGSARPSLRPDSRLSECRITRGTRGLVTTVDVAPGRSGTAGRRAAATRSSPRSVSTWAISATSTAVSGIASTSLRKGRCHAFCSISASTSSPSRKRISTSAITASACTKSERGSRSSTSNPPCPSTNPAATNTARATRSCARQCRQGPDHQQRAEDRGRLHQEVDPGGDRRHAWKLP